MISRIENLRLYRDLVIFVRVPEIRWLVAINFFAKAIRLLLFSMILLPLLLSIVFRLASELLDKLFDVYESTLAYPITRFIQNNTKKAHVILSPDDVRKKARLPKRKIGDSRE